jgi:hypothetical protein
MNGGVTLNSAVKEVIIYSNDKTTEIARENVTSDTVSFTNVNYVIEEGTENIYVKVVTAKQGKDQAGNQTADFTFELTVSDAEGNESNKAVVLTSIDATGDAAVTPSLAFSVNSTKVSSVTFVSSQ